MANDNVSAVLSMEAGQSDGGTGMTEAFKQALLQCFNDVAWENPDTRTADLSALFAALYPVTALAAVYTQSGAVYDTDSLDSLKSDLVVTAYYEGGTSETVDAADYTLSGTLTAGTSTITVTYREKTATFDVAVTHATIPSGYVTDGLVFFLDALQGFSGSTWTDIVGGKTFSLTDCTNSGNGIVFNGTSSKGVYDGTITTDWLNETIEAAIQTSQTATKDVFCQPYQNNTVGISLRLARVSDTSALAGFALTGELRSDAEVVIPATKTLSLRVGLCIANKIKKTVYFNNTPSKVVATTIGTRSATAGTFSSYFNGTIYAIRIYNRKLTEDEMKQNQQADIDRYGITI